jgi:hypothetical protein
MADLPRLPEQLLSAIDMAAMLSRLGGRGYQVQEERVAYGNTESDFDPDSDSDFDLDGDNKEPQQIAPPYPVRPRDARPHWSGEHDVGIEMKKPKWTYLILTPLVFLLPSVVSLVVSGIPIHDVFGESYAQRVPELTFFAFIIPYGNLIGMLPPMGLALGAVVYLGAIVSPFLSGWRGGRIACVSVCGIQWALWAQLLVMPSPVFVRGGM